MPTGRFMRNIHRWAANVMVVAVLLHMARAFYTAAYRRPREFNWLIGIGLPRHHLGALLTGYLLPWDQLAYWAITIGANIAQSPREVTDAIGVTEIFDPGGIERFLLLGSETVGAEALIRFYLLHVMILPLALVLLMSVHFWRIRKDGGLARPADADERLPKPEGTVYPVFTQEPVKTYSIAAIVRGRTAAVGKGPENTVPSMPHLFYAELGVFMLTTFVCLALAMFSDAPLKELANPDPENPAKAPGTSSGCRIGLLLRLSRGHRHPRHRARGPRAHSVSRSGGERYQQLVRRYRRPASRVAGVARRIRRFARN